MVVDGRMTNVYRRDGDSWKMVHHRADTSPAMIEVVRKLPSGG